LQPMLLIKPGPAQPVGPVTVRVINWIGCAQDLVKIDKAQRVLSKTCDPTGF